VRRRGVRDLKKRCIANRFGPIHLGTSYAVSASFVVDNVYEFSVKRERWTEHGEFLVQPSHIPANTEGHILMLAARRRQLQHRGISTSTPILACLQVLCCSDSSVSVKSLLPSDIAV
jgi:hypothetical protein